MQLPLDPWLSQCLSGGRPSVGVLMEICEENFEHLLRLAPEIRSAAGRLVSSRPGTLDLYLEIEEQARYTTVARLTHYFPTLGDGESHPEPDARLRVYHDAHQVEVIDLRQTVLPMRNQYQPPALTEKWRANLFLNKWLAFCLRQGHGFTDRPLGQPVRHASSLTV